jgi:hypothetical protein
LSRKDWHSGAIGAVLSVNFGRRGFLAGVVRKRLKLKLGSKKVDGNRVYQIASGE